jgi:membrane-bound ClpP family serine protease
MAAVTTFGEFIPQGKKVKVAKIEGATIIVEPVKEA